MSRFPEWDSEINTNRMLPKWALPLKSNTKKLHCFVENVSLCGNHTGYKVDYIEDSGIVYDLPSTVCQKCMSKWKKQYHTEY